MQVDLKQCARAATACVLAVLFAFPGNLLAESHVVNPAELQQQLVAAARVRQENLAALTSFLSSARAEKAMKDAHINPEQVKNSIGRLDDAELAQLAARAQKAQADFAAGSLSDRDLIVIMLAVVVLVLVIVAVR